MSNDMIPVAYALTETDSHIKAMRATRDLAALSPGTTEILLRNDLMALRHWAGLWNAMRGVPEHTRLVVATVADARSYLAQHLGALTAFVERVNARVEEEDTDG